MENRQGILFNDDPVLRPLLQVSKEELKQYAKAEKLSYFEDPGNSDSVQMRAYLRTILIPEMETRYPSIRKTIARYAAAPQSKLPEVGATLPAESMIYALEQLTSKLKRTQKNEILAALNDADGKLKITLPGGVVLRREKTGFFIEFPRS